jgi:hypothetical protein
VNEDTYTPGTWRHMDWCPTPTGHDGDCWAEDKRVNRPDPEPVMVIVELDENNREIRREEIR